MAEEIILTTLQIAHINGLFARNKKAKQISLSMQEGELIIKLQSPKKVKVNKNAD